MNRIDDAIQITIIIVIAFGLCSLAFVADKVWERYVCSKQAEITNTEYRYDYIVGCYFKEDGKWVKHNENNAETQKIYLKGTK